MPSSTHITEFTKRQKCLDTSRLKALDMDGLRNLVRDGWNALSDMHCPNPRKGPNISIFHIHGRERIEIHLIISFHLRF